MDPLGSIVQTLQLKSVEFFQMRLAAPWGMSLSSERRSMFHIVESGKCWLIHPDQAAPIALHRHDLVVVTDQAAYALADGPDTATTPVHTLLERREPDGTIRPTADQVGSVTQIICSRFEGQDNRLYPLFNLLPSLVILRANDPHPYDWLNSILPVILNEMQIQQPGYETLIGRLLDVVFIMVLRSWMESPNAEGQSGLRALYHPQIGRVLSLMHLQPEQHWTIERLAQAAHISRSTLAAQFTTLVGEPPMTYLARWRMHLAMTRMADDPALGLDAIARAVGYSSAYAFSKAFKRFAGVAPTVYREQMQRD